MGTVGGIFSALSLAVIGVVVSVVILVLYLIIKTTITRKKRESGIQKALGFTTLQLMNQIALNLTTPIIFGVTLGAAFGHFGFNYIFVTLFGGMVGIVQVDLPTPLSWVAMASAALILLAYFVSLLLAWGIRKISAYVLVSE